MRGIGNQVSQDSTRQLQHPIAYYLQDTLTVEPANDPSRQWNLSILSWVLTYPSPEDASNPDVRLVDLPGQGLNLEVETVAVDGSKVASVASPADTLQRIEISLSFAPRS